MQFNLVHQKLLASLKKGLPGEQAQQRLAPGSRPGLSQLDLNNKLVKKAGVLMLLEPLEGRAAVVLTQRHDYPGAHGGQISLPGGKREKEDTSFLDTALRETEEEIGISRNKLELLGELSPLYIPPSNFLVHPYLALSKTKLQKTAEEKEVAEILHVPLDELAQSLNPKQRIKLKSGFTLETPAFVWQERVIWGATAMMLSELLALLDH